MGIVCRVIRLQHLFVYRSLLPSFLISAVLLIFGVFLNGVIIASDWVEISIISAIFMMMFVILLIITGELKIEQGKIKLKLL
jgi:ABC-type Fe3+-siderophore transport system permease subunit